MEKARKAGSCRRASRAEARRARLAPFGTRAFTNATAVFILPPSEFDPEPGYPEAELIIDSVVSALSHFQETAYVLLVAHKTDILGDPEFLAKVIEKLCMTTTVGNACDHETYLREFPARTIAAARINISIPLTGRRLATVEIRWEAHSSQVTRASCHFLPVDPDAGCPLRCTARRLFADPIRPVLCRTHAPDWKPARQGQSTAAEICIQYYVSFHVGCPCLAGWRRGKGNRSSSQ